MNAKEFLEQLENCLAGMPEEERESAMAYYREYFMEAGEDKEEEAAASLGSPQSVAERIINESEDGLASVVFSENSGTQPDSSDKPTGERTALGVLILIVAFPIWFPLMVAGIAVSFSFAVVPIALIVASGASFVQGIFDLVSSNIGYGLMSLGMGIMGAGFVMLLWKPFFKIGKLIEEGITRFFKKVFGRRTK